MKVVSDKIESKEQDIYHVHFENGSRTKIHQHNGNQVLIGVKGKGSLEIFKKYGQQLRQTLKLKKLREFLSMKETLYIFQQKHSTLMDQSDKKKEFSHIAINIHAKKKFNIQNGMVRIRF